jgi:PST family polysaccharide transporter
MKNVLHNFFQLVLIQAFGILTPIILTPFILQKVGLEEYGIIATAQSLSVFFILLTDFGFNVTTVRKLAQSQQDQSTQHKIIESVLILKLLLFLIAAISYVGMVFLIPHFRDQQNIYLSSFMLVMGQTFLPIWYYQGTGQLRKTSLPILVSKLLTIIVMLWLVRGPDDSHWVNLVFGTGTLISGIILHIPILKKHSIRFRLMQRQWLWQEFKENLPMFSSNLCTVLYANSTMLLMSFILNPTQLGYYGLADKLLQWIKSGLVLIHNAVYPTLCKLVVEEPANLIAFLSKTYRWVWVLVFSGALFFYLKTDWIVGFFIKTQNEVPSYFAYLGFIIFMVSLNMPFFQSLLAWKCERPILMVVLISSIISIALNVMLVSDFGVPASLWILFGIETGIALTYFLLFRFFKTRFIIQTTQTEFPA